MSSPRRTQPASADDGDGGSLVEICHANGGRQGVSATPRGARLGGALPLVRFSLCGRSCCKAAACTCAHMQAAKWNIVNGVT